MSPILPESAPFSPEQRAWLNGFFAGVLGLDQSAASGIAPNGVAPNGVAPNGMAPNGLVADISAPAQAEAETAEEIPWHDPNMPLEERLQLAEGKPHSRILMAAMAQLDCGACGYLCKTYAEAIAAGEEKSLTKCTPGGRETAKKLKELVAKQKEAGGASDSGASNGGASNGGAASNGAAGNGVAAPASQSAPSAAPAQSASPTQSTAAPKSDEPGRSICYNRNDPFPARVLRVEPLNKSGSSKDVRFVALDLAGSGLTYEPGDALGVYPENCAELVEEIVEALGATGEEPVVTPESRVVPARLALAKAYVITRGSEELLSLLIEHANDERERECLRALLDDDAADDDAADESAAHWDVLDLLRRFPSARPPVAELVPSLMPLEARLYSIASSQRAHPTEVHLAVGVVRYTAAQRLRKGVASTFLADSAQAQQKVAVFVHPSPGFRLPPDDNTPVIMVGPGTGIAPFRAFLQERGARGATGKSWLFFGDQRRDCDFFCEDELRQWLAQGVLARLDTAFSRDQEQKIYVQQRMMESAADIWKWLEEGAHFYVCGDAQRMAKDVDGALHHIVVEQGHMSQAEARAYVHTLARARRYQRDVY